MDLLTTLSAANSIVAMSREIAPLVKAAQESPVVARRVLLYLTVAQASVRALGLERQRILTGVRRCDIEEVAQVDALLERLDTYLYQDNVRPHLIAALRGLDRCREQIRREAQSSLWRRRDKEAAAQKFDATLQTLLGTLRGLTDNFYPGGSGMGIQTLMPIYQFLSDWRRRRQSAGDESAGRDDAVQVAFAELGALAVAALTDPSHEEWLRTTGQIEAYIAELQLAFSIKVLRNEQNDAG